MSESEGIVGENGETIVIDTDAAYEEVLREIYCKGYRAGYEDGRREQVRLQSLSGSRSLARFSFDK